MSRGFQHKVAATSYGGWVIRSDLALAALATAAVPGMRPVSVAAVRSGDDNPLHQTALVEDVTGRKWVVRSPLGAAGVAELELNDELTRQLGKHLPFKVPAAAGYADIGADGRAAVYPYVEGLALSLRHLPTGPGLASAVGRAIAAVHNIPRELFEEHAVPVFDAAQFRARKLAELDRAAETGHVPNGLLARWEHALDAAPMWQFATTPVHGSLDGSSFLVVFSEDDAASGRIVGLTGWDRAQIADPAEDFARLVERANPRAVDAVFESYSIARSQRPDGYLLHRARLASEMRLLTGLVAAVGTEDEDFVRTRADELRKLDRLTANDDSLVPRTALEAPVSDTDKETRPVATARDETVVDMDAAGGEESSEESSEEIEGAGVVSEAADATAPVPPPVAAPVDAADDDEVAWGDDEAVLDDDEPAFIVERPSESSHLEPAHPHELPKHPTVSPADVTAPIPMFRPVDRSAEAASAVPPAAQDSAEKEPTGIAGATDSQPGEMAGPHTPAGDGLDEPGDGVDQPVDTEESRPDGLDENADHEAENENVADENTENQDTENEDEADERMHSLYGMPEADEVDPWESGRR